jgi:hypothetical protein
MGLSPSPDNDPDNWPRGLFEPPPNAWELPTPSKMPEVRRTPPHNIQYSVFSIQYSVFSIQYSVFSIQYSVFSIQYSVFSNQ